MAKRGLWSLSAIVLVLGGVLIFFHNCGHPRIQHQKFPAIGQSVNLAPVGAAKPLKEDHQYQHILIYFGLGGRTLTYDEDVVVRMFESEKSTQPIYEFSAGELRDMYRTTDCPRDLLKYLENAYLGDALFCNSRLDLSRVHHFVAVKKGSDSPKIATSYIREFAAEEDNMVAITINMF